MQEIAYYFDLQSSARLHSVRHTKILFTAKIVVVNSLAAPLLGSGGSPYYKSRESLDQSHLRVAPILGNIVIFSKNTPAFTARQDSDESRHSWVGAYDTTHFAIYSLGNVYVPVVCQDFVSPCRLLNL